MKQLLKNKTHTIIEEHGYANYNLFYSSLLDQLYVVYICIMASILLYFAQPLIWPILLLIFYFICAYLFGAQKNNSFALVENALLVINGRTPFANFDVFEFAAINAIHISSNKNPLFRIFIIPSNTYVQITDAFNKEHKYYTNLDFEEESKDKEKCLEALAHNLNIKGVRTTIDIPNFLFD